MESAPTNAAAAELRGVSRAGVGEKPGKETNTIWEAAYMGDIRTLRAFVRNGFSVNRENPVRLDYFTSSWQWNVHLALDK